jgi:AcrR family transcriptional regulator
MILNNRKLCETVEASGLWEAALPGMSPARQRRSRETVVSLIATGHAMLNDRSLDALSIDELCAAAGCTIGAFYSRFESKESYFDAIQFVVCADRDAALSAVVTEARRAKWPLRRICSALVGDLAQWYWSNSGVLRASLLHRRNGESGWTSIKALGTRHKAVWVELLKRHLPIKLPARERKLRVQFAHQVVNGTLVHMLLNDPGPLKIGDAATPTRLTANMISYLLSDAAAPSKS